MRNVNGKYELQTLEIKYKKNWLFRIHPLNFYQVVRNINDLSSPRGA